MTHLSMPLLWSLTDAEPPTVVAKVAKMKPRKKKGMSLRAFIMLMTMA